MSSKLSPILTQCTVQRVFAGIVFVPLMAYCFAPFRDMTLSFSQRMVFWSGVLVLALAATWMARKLVREKLLHSGLLLRDFAFALLILLLFAPSLWLLSWVVFTLNGQMAPGLLMVAPYGVLIATGFLLIRQREDTNPQDATVRPRLYNRLPAAFQGEIYRLTVRDHSVDVVTSEGTFTIRSRLTDAIADMEPVPGHCTHRSHWVVDAAIAGVEKQGGKICLRLRNDDLVPVSRKYKPLLEEDGLL